MLKRHPSRSTGEWHAAERRMGYGYLQTRQGILWNEITCSRLIYKSFINTLTLGLLDLVPDPIRQL